MGGGTIVKEGYLIKSPPLNSKGVKRWQKRYFRLLSTKMFEYYKAKPTKEEPPRGLINLEDCRAVNSGLNHNKHKFVFSIELKDRTYFLVADSEDEMTTWVTTLCSHCGFSNPVTGPEMSGSATLPAGGMPFKARFRTTSESSTVENLYLATAMQRNVRQQIKQDSVEVKAGTSLSEAFSKKGLRGGSIKGGQTSGGFDMSQLRLRSTSVTSTDSEVSLPDRSPGLLSSSCSDSPFRRSTSSTPSNSAGLTVGKAQTLPPIPADVPSPQLGGPLNPLYGSPSSFPANPLYNTPSPTAPSPTANPMYNSPRAFQNDSNPLYNSPTKLAPAQSQYSTPSSIPVNSGPMYNTLPSRGPRSALLGSAPPMPFEGANPALNYDTPKSHAASEAPAAMQMPDSSPHTSMVSRSGSKGHRSALLKEFSQSVSEDSDSPSSSVEAPAPASLVKAPVPKPRTDRKLKEPIPEEVLAEQQEDIPPSINREAKPTLTKDESPEGDVSEEPPPIDRSHKPHFEPPKPPVVDRATKPLLATATAIQEDSSEGEDDDDDGEEEFGELPQQSDDTLHYVKLVHLQSPPPPVMRPVPKPRRVLSHEADTSVDGGTEYSMVDKERTSELHRRLSDLAAAVPSCPDEGPCVQDVAVAEQPRYVNLTHEGEVDEENDPQYYTVMKNSEGAVVPEGHDAYITLIPSGPPGSESVPAEEDPYIKVLR